MWCRGAFQCARAGGKPRAGERAALRIRRVPVLHPDAALPPQGAAHQPRLDVPAARQDVHPDQNLDCESQNLVFYFLI